jgi:hypothetical protein
MPLQVPPTHFPKSRLIFTLWMKTLINILIEFVDAFIPKHLSQSPSYDPFEEPIHFQFFNN